MGDTLRLGARYAALRARTMHRFLTWCEPFTGIPARVQEGPSAPTDATLLRAFQASRQGRAVILLGSGPSATMFPWASIPLAGVDVCALNGAWRLCEGVGVRPTLGVLNNPLALAEHGLGMTRAVTDRVWVSSSAWREAGPVWDVQPILFDQWAYPGMADGHWEDRLDHPLFQSGTVAHAAIQILVGMGYGRVLCVGVDLVDAPHAYQASPADAERNRRVFVPRLARMRKGLEVARAAVEHRGGCVVRTFSWPFTGNPFPSVEDPIVFLKGDTP